MIIAGIDEVGRGAVAGPVTACACVINSPLYKRRGSFPWWSPSQKRKKGDYRIADSKLLTPEEREYSYEWITSHSHFGIGSVSHDVIEERGIIFATQSAMSIALEQLQSQLEVHEVIVDGLDVFRFSVPHRSIVSGDMLHPEIAAASIVAKVTRDRYMKEIAKDFPVYGFHKHKGYGTTEHIGAIKQHGTCAIHRKSFLRAILENQELPFNPEAEYAVAEATS